MATFSEIVDDVAQQAGYSNISVVASHVNRAVKAFTPIHHFSDLVEDTFNQKSCDARSKIVLPNDYRTMQAVRVDNRIMVPMKKPGLGQQVHEGTHYYYETGIYLAIRGHIAQKVDIAYYRVTPSFLYFPVEKRLLRTSQNEHDSLYEFRHPDSDEWLPLNRRDENHMASYNRHVNWLIEAYEAQLLNGALSNAYNAKGNIEVGGRLFQQFRLDVAEIKAAHMHSYQGEN